MYTQSALTTHLSLHAEILKRQMASGCGVRLLPGKKTYNTLTFVVERLLSLRGAKNRNKLSADIQLVSTKLAIHFRQNFRFHCLLENRRSCLESTRKTTIEGKRVRKRLRTYRTITCCSFVSSKTTQTAYAYQSVCEKHVFSS